MNLIVTLLIYLMLPNGVCVWLMVVLAGVKLALPGVKVALAGVRLLLGGVGLNAP